MSEQSQEKFLRLQAMRRDIERLEAEFEELIEREHYEELGLPTVPGWYLGADGNIARLTGDGCWDDGWGNGGIGYGYPVPPMRRLVVQES